MNDLISRQAAIEALGEMPEVWEEDDDEGRGEQNQWYMDKIAIEALPTVDLSEYCDKLWKTAYERGKAETIIRCDECKHWDVEWIPAVGEGHYCPMMDHVMVGDEWCCYGERRTDG